MMRYVVFLMQLILCFSSIAATPIDGLYSSFFGGYLFIPGNIAHSIGDVTLNATRYQGGFDGGGNLGYKSNPMRYEAEITYLKANIHRFYLNNTLQTNVSGYNNGVFGMANVYYDVPNSNPLLQPYIGAGVGYGWIQANLHAGDTPYFTSYKADNSTFAYQAMAGVSFNFAENYALSLGYRYVGTSNLSQFGEIFQAHMANLGATYRFDGNNYK